MLRNKAIILPTLASGILSIAGHLMTDAYAWQSDNGDGTFTNPPLYADYPDPSLIRVGEDFYMATTTFVNSPGVRILHSLDLVNWEIAGHVAATLEGNDKFSMVGGTSYRAGFFAAALRRHGGTFYVVLTPVGMNTRVYYSDAVSGPWAYHELDRGLFDPGFFIDDDGTGYIASSGGWDGHVRLVRLTSGFSQVDGTFGVKDIFHNPFSEGCQVVKRNGWYYIFQSIPRRLGMTVSRSTDITSTNWETRNQIDDRTGGHQGAIVDLPDGSWYGYAMCDSGAIGRMTNIGPIFWEDDWPVWGTPDARDRIPATAPKPVLGKPLAQPATSDDFDSPTLGPQWAWNHNPDDARWSLTERPGFLRLRPTRATEFWTAGNTLTQKGQGPQSYGVVKLDLSNLQAGDIAGFGTLGKINGHIAVTADGNGAKSLSMNVINDAVGSHTEVAALPFEGNTLYLRADLDFKTNRAVCSYSPDGTNWTPLGGQFQLAFDWRTGTFQGEQFAVFCYNPTPGAGYVDVDSFTFGDSAPLAAARGRP